MQRWYHPQVQAAGHRAGPGRAGGRTHPPGRAPEGLHDACRGRSQGGPFEREERRTPPPPQLRMLVFEQMGVCFPAATASFFAMFHHPRTCRKVLFCLFQVRIFFFRSLLVFYVARPVTMTPPPYGACPPYPFDH